MTINFKKWLLLQMGGNVVINDVPAEKIDLTKINRKEIVQILKTLFKEINISFKKFSGFELWSEKLLDSNNFLSGSTLHLFDIENINDIDFKKHKPLVGDIDLQVDINFKNQLFNYLKTLTNGSSFDNILFKGFKSSGEQFITLWQITKLNITIQIDFELVAYKNGKPTDWSNYSHSSSWDDMKQGIKGVFHKYLLRAFQSTSVKEILILPKTSRGKEKTIKKSVLAFSTKGLRKRYAPVLDINGKQTYKDNKPIFTEIPTEKSVFITDFAILFLTFFKQQGTDNEIKQLESFIGTINLMKKYMTDNEKNQIIDGFANLLWGKQAQGLVRGDSNEDYRIKKIAFDYITKELHLKSINDYYNMIQEYYKGYK